MSPSEQSTKHTLHVGQRKDCPKSLIETFYDNGAVRKRDMRQEVTLRWRQEARVGRVE